MFVRSICGLLSVLFAAESLLGARAVAAPENLTPLEASNNPLFDTTSSGLPAPAGAPLESATLRALASALDRQDLENAGRLTWRFLALMARARQQGVGPSEYLGAAYRTEKLRPIESVPVQRCLLVAWSAAQSLYLFTSENLALMDRGESPRVPRGPQQGRLVIFESGTPPEMTMKIQVAGKNAPQSRATSAIPAAPTDSRIPLPPLPSALPPETPTPAKSR